MIKKIIAVASLISVIGIIGCSGYSDKVTSESFNDDKPHFEFSVDTLGEEKGSKYTLEDNVITALSGSHIDFNLINQKSTINR